MKNIDKLGLEYSKLVNNTIDFNLIYNKYHNMNINLDYVNCSMEDYIGVDIESLEYYEDWLSGEYRGD